MDLTGKDPKLDSPKERKTEQTEKMLSDLSFQYMTVDLGSIAWILSQVEYHVSHAPMIPQGKLSCCR